MRVPEFIKARLTEIDPDPDQPRTHASEDGLACLAKTLAIGQVQPILVYRTGGGRLRIIDGHRRWEAAKLGGSESIDALVVDPPAGPDQTLERQLLANLREDLPPLDYALAVERLMKAQGWKVAEAAERLGTSPARISRATALTRLPEGVKERLRLGEITADAAYQISRVGDAASQEALASEAAGGGLSRDAVAGKVRSRSKREPVRGGPVATKVSALLGGGRAVTIAGPGLASLEQLIQWLEELLAKARKARPQGTELPTFIALLRDQAKAARGGSC